MRLILTEQNPDWKLPERRVAKYLKRILKSRKDPSADNIDANVDEISLAASSASSKLSIGSKKKKLFKRFRKSKGDKAPQDNLPNSILDTDFPIRENVESQAIPEDVYTDQSVDENNQQTGCCEGSNCAIM